MNTSQLKWQCRRGTKELDLLLTHYLEKLYPHATTIEQRLFQKLLELTNEELSDYLLGKGSPIQLEMTPLIKKIRQFTD